MEKRERSCVMLTSKNIINLENELSSFQTPEQALAKFTYVAISSHLLKVSAVVHKQVTDTLYNETVLLFRKKYLDGFGRDAAPVDYIEETYGIEINKKLKTYIFRHLIIDFLIDDLIVKKIPFANYPRLTHISKTSENNMLYTFDLSLTESIELKEWKNFAFKIPKRKRYKDLDKQVLQFIEQNTCMNKKLNSTIVEEDDWVGFSATLLDQDLMRVSPTITSNFWIKIKRNEVTNKFKNMLLNKCLGESFVTNDFYFDEDTDYCENLAHSFMINIKSIVKGKFLSVDLFKQTFKLKNKAEMHNKIMEVFSYRNDISQRRTIIEEIFNLFLAKHRFEVPKHLILRRQEDILSTLMHQPDYHVYKSQKDFLQYVELLAEKELKEETVIDQIAYKEGLESTIEDIQFYLNLVNNKRLKEFTYFKPTNERLEDMDVPINHSILAHTILREKTLNYVIHMLTH
jgi:FKBP-type peptidyl-prolyl cis-trans isomerase (trigger factor)